MKAFIYIDDFDVSDYVLNINDFEYEEAFDIFSTNGRIASYDLKLMYVSTPYDDAYLYNVHEYIKTKSLINKKSIFVHIQIYNDVANFIIDKLFICLPANGNSVNIKIDLKEKIAELHLVDYLYILKEVEYAVPYVIENIEEYKLNSSKLLNAYSIYVKKKLMRFNKPEPIEKFIEDNRNNKELYDEINIDNEKIIKNLYEYNEDTLPKCSWAYNDTIRDVYLDDDCMYLKNTNFVSVFREFNFNNKLCYDLAVFKGFDVGIDFNIKDFFNLMIYAKTFEDETNYPYPKHFRSKRLKRDINIRSLLRPNEYVTDIWLGHIKVRINNNIYNEVQENNFINNVQYNAYVQYQSFSASKNDSNEYFIESIDNKLYDISLDSAMRTCLIATYDYDENAFRVYYLFKYALVPVMFEIGAPAENGIIKYEYKDKIELKSYNLKPKDFTIDNAVFGKFAASLYFPKFGNQTGVTFAYICSFVIQSDAGENKLIFHLLANGSADDNFLNGSNDSGKNFSRVIFSNRYSTARRTENNDIKVLSYFFGSSSYGGFVHGNHIILAYETMTSKFGYAISNTTNNLNDIKVYEPSEILNNNATGVSIGYIRNNLYSFRKKNLYIPRDFYLTDKFYTTDIGKRDIFTIPSYNIFDYAFITINKESILNLVLDYCKLFSMKIKHYYDGISKIKIEAIPLSYFEELHVSYQDVLEMSCEYVGKIKDFSLKVFDYLESSNTNTTLSDVLLEKFVGQNTGIIKYNFKIINRGSYNDVYCGQRLKVGKDEYGYIFEIKKGLEFLELSSYFSENGGIL